MCLCHYCVLVCFFLLLDRQASACPCGLQLVQPRSGLLPGSQPSCCHLSPLPGRGVGLLVHSGHCGAHHAQRVLHEELGGVAGWSESSAGTPAHEGPSCCITPGGVQVRGGGGGEGERRRRVWSRCLRMCMWYWFTGGWMGGTVYVMVRRKMLLALI